MDALSLLNPGSTSTRSGDWSYLLLRDATSESGPTGVYALLTLEDPSGHGTITATADQKYFNHLTPYLQIWRESQEDQSVEPPAVPVFRGRDDRWRFSWLAAEHDYPELTPPRLPESDDGRPFRLQVTVNPQLAARFKTAAAARGMTHNQFLLQLIRDAST